MHSLAFNIAITCTHLHRKQLKGEFFVQSVLVSVRVQHLHHFLHKTSCNREQRSLAFSQLESLHRESVITLGMPFPLTFLFPAAGFLLYPQKVRIELNFVTVLHFYPASLVVKPVGEVRLEAVHLHGTDEMSNKDVLGYFRAYGPRNVEWINDSSCRYQL